MKSLKSWKTSSDSKSIHVIAQGTSQGILPSSSLRNYSDNFSGILVRFHWRFLDENPKGNPEGLPEENFYIPGGKSKGIFWEISGRIPGGIRG